MKAGTIFMDGVLAELKALRQAYGGAQQRCSASLSLMHRRNQALEAEVMRLRARLIARETALAWAREDSARLLASVPGLPSRVTLACRIEALATRMQSLLRMVLNLEKRLPASSPSGRDMAAEAGKGAHVPATGASQPDVSGHADAGPAAGGRSEAGGSPASPLAGLSGQAGQGLQPVVPAADAAMGQGRQARLDEVGEDIPDLEERLVEADLVICQTGCLSHQAYWRMQDHCRRHNKPCVLVAQPDALRIVRIHNRDESVVPAPAMAGDAAMADAADARMPDTMAFDALMDEDSRRDG